MHELSIAQELLRLCRGRLQPGDTLGAVHVAVGELASVEPEQLRFAWEAVVAHTPHEGARLHVDWIRARQLCTDCGVVSERQPGSWLRLCPQCGNPLQVSGGDDLDLLSVEPRTSHPFRLPSQEVPS